MSISPSQSSAADLDLMFERAISGPGDTGDAVAIKTLTTLARNNAPLTRHLVEKIGERLHANSVGEVRRTIDVLDTCMHTADDAFRHEVGRFRFLNEIVKLLSPTRAIRPPPESIRQRLMDLMLVWMMQHPDEKKIAEAYLMLLKQGVPHKPPSDHRVAERVRAQRPPGTEQRTVFDTIPRELLLSTNPNDVQMAKLLIEQALDHEQRAQTLRAQQRAEVRLAAEVASVLDDMLAARQRAATMGGVTAIGTSALDDGELMRDLFEQCRSLQISVASFAANGGGCEPHEYEELLQTSFALQTVIKRYNTVVLQGLPDTTPATKPPAAPAIKTATSASGLQSVSNTELLTAVLGAAPLVDNMLALTDFRTTDDSSQSSMPFDDLGTLDDIFTKVSLESSGGPAEAAATDALLMADTSGDKSPVWRRQSNEAAAVTAVDVQPPIMKRCDEKVIKPVSELDMFGLESVITGLKYNLTTVKTSADSNESPTFEDNIISPSAGSNDHDDTLLVSVPTDPSLEQSLPPPAPPSTALAELHVDLATIRPAPQPGRVLLDDAAGLHVVLHHAIDRPRPDVGVCVLTVTNKSAQPISALSIDASVSKPCKVRLLAASGAALPACKPFRPPTEDVTQLLLVANATAGAACDIVCILSYRLGADPDETKESINVTGVTVLH